MDRKEGLTVAITLWFELVFDIFVYEWNVQKGSERTNKKSETLFKKYICLWYYKLHITVQTYTEGIEPFLNKMKKKKIILMSMIQ